MLQSQLIWCIFFSIIKTGCCDGLTIDRSELSIWDTAPSLSVGYGTLDNVSSQQPKTPGTNKTPTTTSEYANLTKQLEELLEKEGKREKRAEVIFENKENTSDSTTQTTRFHENVSRPKSAIVLLVNRSGEYKSDLWKDFKDNYSFPVQGFAKSNCDGPIEPNTRLSYRKSTYRYFDRNACLCMDYTLSYICYMLRWAHSNGGMTTAIVSMTYFPCKSFGEKMNGDYCKVIGRKAVRETMEDHVNPWRWIEFNKNGITSGTCYAIAKPEKESDVTTTVANDGIGGIFDVFSKIRMAFFRKVLETIFQNMTAEVKSRWPEVESPPSPSNFTDLLKRMLKELETFSMENGMLMVIITPENELNNAMELLQHRISEEQTLVVVTGLCSGELRAPYFAKGPGASSLRLEGVWDIPMALENLLQRESKTSDLLFDFE